MKWGFPGPDKSYHVFTNFFAFRPDLDKSDFSSASTWGRWPVVLWCLKQWPLPLPPETAPETVCPHSLHEKRASNRATRKDWNYSGSHLKQSILNTGKDKCFTTVKFRHFEKATKGLVQFQLRLYSGWGFLPSHWDRQLKFSAYASFLILWSLSKFELI